MLKLPRHFERAKHREKTPVDYLIAPKKDFYMECANLEQFSHDASLVRNDGFDSRPYFNIQHSLLNIQYSFHLLHIHQPPIDPILHQQLVMRSSFSDLPFLQNDDLICVADGR